MRNVEVKGVTIFFNYPGVYSAKLFKATYEGVKYIGDLGTSENLAEIRKLVNKKFKMRLEKSKNDDLSIIETWM